MREKWTNEEMILTLYIYLTHDPEELHKRSKFLIEFCSRLNRYTGKTRTVSSIEMRISNYKSADPAYKKTGLANGGKGVIDYWDMYHDRIDFMTDMYNKFVASTYTSISSEAVEELDNIAKLYECEYVDDKDSFIETTINIRNGIIQRIFRDNLILEFNQKCALCQINQKKLLVASHIIPYSKCENKSDMINHFNGILLCPNHDALFDKKLITFDQNGKIIIDSSISEELYVDLNIDNNMHLDKQFLTDERLKFLKRHTDNK